MKNNSQKIIILMLMIFSIFNVKASINEVNVLNDFDEILTEQANALDESKDKILNQNYKFKEYISDIGFSRSGMIGLTNTRLFSGIEVKWRKKKDQEFSSDPNHYQIDGDINFLENQYVINSIIENFSKKKSYRKSKRLRRKLKKSLLKIQEKMNELSSIRAKGWQFSGIRLDINFGADGSFWFFAKAGAVMRARINWNYTKKDNDIILPTKNMEFLGSMLEGIDDYQSKHNFDKYDLQSAYIGIGLNHGFTLFSSLNTKLSYLGCAYFKRISSNTSIDDYSPKVKKKMIKGIKKSLDLMNKLSKKMHNKSNKWEIHKFLALFTLSQKNIFSFLSSGALTQIELNYVKRK